eukprot:jgi/Mesen1/6316/ME000325S05450
MVQLEYQETAHAGNGVTHGAKHSNLLAPAIFLAVCAVEFCLNYLQLHLAAGRPSRQEIKLQAELRDLRRKAESLNTPDTFAKAAKFQRAAAAKEKELNALREGAPQSLARPLIRQALVAVVKAGLYGGLLCAFWHTPILVVPPSLVYPFGGWLAFPKGSLWQGGGALAIGPWLVLCSRVSNYIWAASKKEGMVSGVHEGREVGLKSGFEMGEEVGFYKGCLRVWKAVLAKDESAFSSRAARAIRALDQQLASFPLLSPEEESLHDQLSSICSKFRALSSMLGVHLTFEGHSARQEAADLTSF